MDMCNLGIPPVRVITVHKDILIPGAPDTKNMLNSQIDLKTLNSYSAAKFNMKIYIHAHKAHFFFTETVTWVVTLTAINSAAINRKKLFQMLVFIRSYANISTFAVILALLFQTTQKQTERQILVKATLFLKL